MNKIEKLFKEWGELTLIEADIKKSLRSQKSIWSSLYSNYKIRLTKKDKEAISSMNQTKNIDKRLWGYLYVDIAFHGNFMFWYLNKIIAKTKELEGFNSSKKDLFLDTKFQDTLSEFEINAFFNNYAPSFNPKIVNSTKRLDSKIKLDKRYLFFEVLTPHNTIPADGIVRELKNTIKGKIKDKVITQIKEAGIKEKTAIVLFVNISSSGHMKEQIKDAFLGRGKYTLKISNQTGEVVQTLFERDNNGINLEQTDSQYLSAIVFYSQKIFGFRVDLFEKDIILNESAKYPLTPKEFKKIKRFDLRNL